MAAPAGAPAPVRCFFCQSEGAELGRCPRCGEESLVQCKNCERKDCRDSDCDIKSLGRKHKRRMLIGSGFAAMVLLASFLFRGRLEEVKLTAAPPPSSLPASPALDPSALALLPADLPPPSSGAPGSPAPLPASPDPLVAAGPSPGNPLPPRPTRSPEVADPPPPLDPLPPESGDLLPSPDPLPPETGDPLPLPPGPPAGGGAPADPLPLSTPAGTPAWGDPTTAAATDPLPLPPGPPAGGGSPADPLPRPTPAGTPEWGDLTTAAATDPLPLPGDSTAPGSSAPVADPLPLPDGSSPGGIAGEDPLPGSVESSPSSADPLALPGGAAMVTAATDPAPLPPAAPPSPAGPAGPGAGVDPPGLLGDPWTAVAAKISPPAVASLDPRSVVEKSASGGGDAPTGPLPTAATGSATSADVAVRRGGRGSAEFRPIQAMLPPSRAVPTMEEGALRQGRPVLVMDAADSSPGAASVAGAAWKIPPRGAALPEEYARVVTTGVALSGGGPRPTAGSKEEEAALAALRERAHTVPTASRIREVLRKSLGLPWGPEGIDPARGGLSPGGYVKYVYGQMGYDSMVPRVVEDQMEMGGQRLELPDYEPQAGDVLFFRVRENFITVGVYYGRVSTTGKEVFFTSIKGRGGVVSHTWDPVDLGDSFLFARRLFDHLEP